MECNNSEWSACSEHQFRRGTLSLVERPALEPLDDEVAGGLGTGEHLVVERVAVLRAPVIQVLVEPQAALAAAKQQKRQCKFILVFKEYL